MCILCLFYNLIICKEMYCFTQLMLVGECFTMFLTIGQKHTSCSFPASVFAKFKLLHVNSILKNT